jgi:hypothetical protein
VGERSHGCRPQIKPGSRGPIQQGWASTASPPPVGPAQCPILDHSRPYPGERRERAAVPARRPAGRPRCTQRSHSLPRRRSHGGRSDRRSKRWTRGTGPCGTRVVAAIVARFWSSLGPPAGSGRRPQRRRNNAPVNSPDEWPRRCPRYGRPSHERSREQRGAADGRRCSRIGGTE